MMATDESARPGAASLSAFAAAVVALLSMTAWAGVAYGGISSSVSVSETEKDMRDWTIAMYWVSDNNLDEYTDYFVQMWIDHLKNTEDVAMCVFLDRLDLPTNISTLTEDGWQEVSSHEELNSSSPDTLASFLEFALTEPSLASDNFMLMVQDHGNGYLGLCTDEGLPDSDLPKVWMSIDDLGAGVRKALDSTGKDIDIISLDACTLGTVEIAYELRGTADYLVASELGVPFDGQNYIALLEGFTDDPDIAPFDLACKLVDDYEAWYAAPLHTLPTLYPYMQDFASLSVIDLNGMEVLADAFETFREAVLPKNDSLGMYMKTASVYADTSLWINNAGVWFYPDIMVMFSTLAESLRETNASVASACDLLVAAADAAVLHDWASWRTRDKVTGLSVFVCPSIGLFEVYWDSFGRAYDSVSLDFVEETGWDLVLKEYFYTVKQYGDPTA